MSGPEIVTLGCRLNAFESDAIRALGRSVDLDGAVIVNSCAVTAEAVRQTRQAVRRARRENPGARIIVAGCAAQLDPDRFAAMEEVDLVLGNLDKLKAESYTAPAERGTKVRVADVMDGSERALPVLGARPGRTRAFVQIQQGCDHRCTFCIIPFARGPSRSLPMDRVVAEIEGHVRSGHAEVVLTGVDISSYGTDLDGRPGLGRLAAAILAAVPELERLRLSSLDPAVEDEELVAALAGEERLMPHLHLSLQAGNDLVLKRMKRRHDRARATELADRLRRVRPGLALGADLIAGFPTESEAMFAESLDMIEDCGLTHLHVFPYSPRGGTPAARMKQLPATVRRDRARVLREAGATAHHRFLDGRVGASAQVLVETGDAGYTPDYARARLNFTAPPGALVAARLVARADDCLIAEAAA